MWSSGVWMVSGLELIQEFQGQPESQSTGLSLTACVLRPQCVGGPQCLAARQGG